MALHEVEHVCPFCGKKQDCLSNTPGEDGLPEPGDLAICFTCRNPWFFGDDLQPVKPTAAERLELAADERVQKFLRMKAGGKTPREMT